MADELTYEIEYEWQCSKCRKRIEDDGNNMSYCDCVTFDNNWQDTELLPATWYMVEYRRPLPTFDESDIPFE